MTKLFPKHLFAPLIAVIILVSCKKDNGGDDPGGDEKVLIATHADDQHMFSADIDDIANDANIAMETSGTFAQRPGDIPTLICNATIVVDSTSSPRTITITYNGNNCFNTRKRTGVVKLTIPQNVHWKDAGASLTVSFQDLKVTRLADNKSITINGAQTYTNVSGGLVVFLPLSGHITHSITGNGLSVKFDDNTVRTWNVAKQRDFTYDNGIVISTTGTHSDGVNGNTIAEWGTTRYGAAFTTSTVYPVVVRQDCAFRLTSGQLYHVTPLFAANARFGLNSNGLATGCPGTGSYYANISWVTARGDSANVLIPY